MEGFEPPMRESKSRVLTATLQSLHVQKFFPLLTLLFFGACAHLSASFTTVVHYETDTYNTEYRNYFSKPVLLGLVITIGDIYVFSEFPDLKNVVIRDTGEGPFVVRVECEIIHSSCVSRVHEQ